MNKDNLAESETRLQDLASRLLRELLFTILPALLFALVVNVYVAEAAVVDQGPSMQPNLYVGYRVMTEKVSYRLHEPRRGDVVVVNLPDQGIRLIKRVMAVEGEKIEVRGGHVWIDDRPVDEPWVTYFGGPNTVPLVVPDDYVYIVGDNRANSRDSRQLGPVPVANVEGRAIFIYWPLEAAGPLP